MIKRVRPLLVIFIAFFLVSAITYVVVESSAANEGQPSGMVQVLVRPNGQVRGEREGFNGYAIDQLLRPLIVIAAIVVVVAPVITWFKKRRRVCYHPANRHLL